MILVGMSVTLIAQQLDSVAAQKGAVVRVVLTEQGFEPRQVTVKPGIVEFVVRSRLVGMANFELVETGRSESKLSMDRATTIKTAMSLKNRSVLSPGVYELQDLRFPEWKCIVNVQP